MDRIYACAPSSKIEEGDLEELKRGKEYVEKVTSKEVIFTDNIMEEDISLKVEDLEKTLEKEGLAFALCGGEGAINVLAKANLVNAKASLCGFSDITSILNYLVLEKNIECYHMSNLKTFGRENERKLSKETYLDFEEFIANKTFSITRENFTCIKEGNAEGMLLGGNLTCLLQLAKIYNFTLKGAILVLEDLGYETSPDMLNEKFKELTKLNGFAEVAGIILGNYEHESKIKIEEVASKYFKDLNIPIAKTDKIGHGKTNLILPLGKIARLSTKNGYIKLHL